MRPPAEQAALDAARRYKEAFEAYPTHKEPRLSPMYERCTEALAAVRAWVEECDAMEVG